MQSYNILIVEDDFVNAQFMIKAINKLGHKVVGRVKRADDALQVVDQKEVHIIFMDINIEGSIDGIACAQMINEKHRIPIIYTTAFADSQTIAEATQTNLFGYLIKPFDYPDVEASLNLTIKQNYTQNSKISEKPKEYITLSKSYHYYPKSKTLFKQDESITLTAKERDIFHHLATNLNQNTTNEFLASYVWNNESIASSTIRNTIKRLRTKVPELSIETISGVGYMLKGD